MSTRQKTPEHPEPKDRKPEDSYFKRYGVFCPKRIAEKLVAGAVFSLRKLYNISKRRNDE